MDEWTLFLDRDGVINYAIPEHEHVDDIRKFVLIPSAITAIKMLQTYFKGIFIVSNQRGVDKRILEKITRHMLEELAHHDAFIDVVLYALTVDNMRKPDIGMGLYLKNIYPWINLENGVMVGDSKTDMQFGRSLKMKTVFVSQKDPNLDTIEYIDLVMSDLYSFANYWAARVGQYNHNSA